MDPLKKLHEDVWLLIFQHFTVRDIIKVSLISPLWANSIGDSRSCMKKVWLRFYWPLSDVLSLVESKRKYQNFKIQHGLPHSLIPVYEKYRWTRVMMRDETFNLPDSYIKLMKELAPTVQELDLWNLSQSEPDDPNACVTIIDFPLLEKIELGDISYQLLTVFLGENPKLAEVKHNGVTFYVNRETQTESSKSMRKILARGSAN